jgi:malate dehydrogenase (oxaloacetate-decarboxylating)(NADP+)
VRRCEFIGLLGGEAAWPLAVQEQQRLFEHDPELIVEGRDARRCAMSKPLLDDGFSGSRLPSRSAPAMGITVGPILLGTAKPVHILDPTVSVRHIVNMTALAVGDASVQRYGRTARRSEIHAG